MIRQIAVLILTLIAGALWAQTRVACVGDAIRLGDSPVELQRVLGPKYIVKFFVAEPAAIGMDEQSDFDKSNQLVKARQFHPDIVVVRVGNEEDAYKAIGHIDQLEPTLRNLLLGFKNQKSRPKLFLWVGGERRQGPGLINQDVDAYNVNVLPLLKQAAREAEATVIEAEIPGSVMPREAAEFLAEAIAPSSLKANWRIVRVSSFQADEGPAQNAIDGDPETFWHSEYDPKEAKPPHEIVLDLGAEIWLAGFKYLPRQDGGENGNVKAYEIYVGDSPASQTTLVAKGSFPRGFQQKIARFKSSVKARYIRFVCLSEQNGGPYASAAELDILRDPSKH